MIEEPGVQNASIIDLVTHDPRTDEFALIMVETREWDRSKERMLELHRKVINYLRFALEGEMVRKFPESIDKPVRIQLNYFHPPDIETEEFFKELAKQMQTHGIRFVTKQL